MSNIKPIIIVQGGQWGSEAKGMVAAAFCVDRNVGYAVRTGSINAGHTVYHGGKAYKMQQLPTGWVNPDTRLVIGPGAYIHMSTLNREILELEADGYSIRSRLLIDRGCGIHTEWNEEIAKSYNRHLSIGATGKGCAEAIVSKIVRRGETIAPLFWDYQGGWLDKMGLSLHDTVGILNAAYDEGQQILIEGTQGTHLDLHHGPYPYTTSRMTTAANWIAEAGLSPALEYEVALVVRTFPIRVAGNSGPMPRETSWPAVMREIRRSATNGNNHGHVDESSVMRFEAIVRELAGQHKNTVPINSDGLDQHTWSPDDRIVHRYALSNLYPDALKLMKESFPDQYADLTRVMEMTTVTKKPRRIAEMDLDCIRRAIQLERPAYLVVTFMNYLYPNYWAWDESDFKNAPAADLHSMTMAIKNLEKALGVQVGYISTGPLSENLIGWNLSR